MIAIDAPFRTPLRVGVRAALAALLFLACAPAWAQTADGRDPIAAEALFERGKAAMDQGRTHEACLAFAESQRLDPAGGTLLRLSLCHEAEGKLASAWLEYQEVVRVSHESTGDRAKLAERVRIATEHLATLEPRIPKLAVSVRPDARVAGLRVTANGSPRNEAIWGVPIPVDPGDVTIVAAAPSRLPYQATLHIAEGQQLTYEVPPLSEPSSSPPAPRPAEKARPESTSSVLRPVGIVVGALGVAAVGVGAYFGAHAIAKQNDSDRACPGTACTDPSGVSLEQDAKDAARVADLALVAGVVAVAVGVTLYVVGAPKSVQARGSGVAIAF